MKKVLVSVLMYSLGLGLLILAHSGSTTEAIDGRSDAPPLLSTRVTQSEATDQSTEQAYILSGLPTERYTKLSPALIPMDQNRFLNALARAQSIRINHGGQTGYTLNGHNMLHYELRSFPEAQNPESDLNEPSIRR
ncbi:MAG: hypothetical protein K9N46_16020 [Candidatus Marinimicrobia bacterium]|nr:hypothetical protein [Candidatus Neomarinimicrobiota bacterium]MCF7829583.1 hypothetical protein [Candidatus Neomarinimicrobiota bacterium]MCF7882237.1 hypothetical protein [Candidatus Neomarinimicrobiota bacterium]